MHGGAAGGLGAVPPGARSDPSGCASWSNLHPGLRCSARWLALASEASGSTSSTGRAVRGPDLGEGADPVHEAGVGGARRRRRHIVTPRTSTVLSRRPGPHDVTIVVVCVPDAGLRPGPGTVTSPSAGRRHGRGRPRRSCSSTENPWSSDCASSQAAMVRVMSCRPSPAQNLAQASSSSCGSCQAQWGIQGVGGFSTPPSHSAGLTVTGRSQAVEAEGKGGEGALAHRGGQRQHDDAGPVVPLADDPRALGADGGGRVLLVVGIRRVLGPQGGVPQRVAMAGCREEHRDLAGRSVARPPRDPALEPRDGAPPEQLDRPVLRGVHRSRLACAGSRGSPRARGSA